MSHNRIPGTCDLACLEQGLPRAERGMERSSHDPLRNKMSGAVGSVKVPYRMLTGRMWRGLADHIT